MKGQTGWALTRPNGRGGRFLMVWTVAGTKKEAWGRDLLHTDSAAARAKARRQGVRPVRVIVHTLEWGCDA